MRIIKRSALEQFWLRHPDAKASLESWFGVVRTANWQTVLIDDYEERRYSISKASPQQVLKHLMEARNLTQKDLWKIFASKGITSEVFHGKRSISKTQARKLAQFFHVSVELFI